MGSVKTTVIITTYNWPEALKRVLLAYNRQSFKNFEVIIADDGSEKQTTTLIHELQKVVNYPLRHIWQKDAGFRAAKIRNKAVGEAQGDYLIFTDGDCIPRSSFIQHHVKLKEHGYFVPGNRVLLRDKYTKQALKDSDCISQLSFLEWFFNRLVNNCDRLTPLIYIPLQAWRKHNPKQWKGAQTYNLGLWKKDFIRVNGFDENYQGWGFEDSDLIIRLLNSGIKRKSGRFAVPVFHLSHSMTDREQSEENKRRLLSSIEKKVTEVKTGVKQYL
jgi:glycosyltransferase involved in cell wall biosynthesis